MPKYHELFVNFSEGTLILIGKYYNTTSLGWPLFRFLFLLFYIFSNLVSQLNSCFKCELPTLKLHKGILIVYLAALQCVFITRMP